MSTGRRILLVPLTLFLVSITLGSVHGVVVNEDIEISYDREKVVLRPGGETTMTFTVVNIGDDPVDVAFAFVSVDAPGHSEGYFSTVLTTLQPGASKENELVVSSNARSSDDPDVSNFVVKVFWGSDITLDDEQRPLETTVEGE